MNHRRSPLVLFALAPLAVLPGCVFDDVRSINEQLLLSNEAISKLQTQLVLLDQIDTKLKSIDKSLQSVDAKLTTLDASIGEVNTNLGSLRGTINNIDSAIPFLKLSGDEDDEAGETEGEPDGESEGAPSTDGRSPANIAADAALDAVGEDDQGEATDTP